MPENSNIIQRTDSVSVCLKDLVLKTFTETEEHQAERRKECERKGQHIIPRPIEPYPELDDKGKVKMKCVYCGTHYSVEPSAYEKEMIQKGEKIHSHIVGYIRHDIREDKFY